MGYDSSLKNRGASRPHTLKGVKRMNEKELFKRYLLQMTAVVATAFLLLGWALNQI